MPFTLTRYVPAAVLAADMVSVAEPGLDDETDNDGVDSAAVNAKGEETARFTVPENPLIDDTVIVELPELPALTVIEDGLEEIVKSGLELGTIYETRLFDCGLPRPVTSS